MNNEPTEQSFLKDVADHQMRVTRDDGVDRHITFSEPGTNCFRFDLITWPGHLCYTGDMGTFVFSRVHDMFQFFQIDDRDFNHNKKGLLSINPGYWAEKLLAADRNDGYEEFDTDRFKQVINEYRMDWIRRGGLDKDDRRELWDDVTNQVLDALCDGKFSAMHYAYEFRETYGGKTFEFVDLFDHNFNCYTYRFIWCCYALAWGIGVYRTNKGQAS